MDLTVIIVSHNVKYFLEHCLISVDKAAAGLELEIYVVDNCSTDGTVGLVKDRFPRVKLVENRTNVGYARANNQVLPIAQGEYILFLNPDTIVPEDCFRNCIHYFRSVQGIGALGVKMIDGSGRVLPESKRGFPTAWNSFAKMAGLSSVFPRSALFSGYYHGDLSLEKNQVIDVLSGAFMMIPREVLLKTGGFDDRFFMYAEDIDLSYRIQKAGFKNHYLAEVSIIHFKGESTRKDKQYVRMFYTAMLQFIEKHYTTPLQRLQSIALRVAIKGRAAMAASMVRHPHDPTASQEQYHFSFHGDAESIKEAISISQVAEERQYEVHAAKQIVVLCEGPSYSFKELISKMQGDAPTVFSIHAHNASSILYSADKEVRGRAIR